MTVWPEFINTLLPRVFSAPPFSAQKVLCIVEARLILFIAAQWINTLHLPINYQIVGYWVITEPNWRVPSSHLNEGLCKLDSLKTIIVVSSMAALEYQIATDPTFVILGFPSWWCLLWLPWSTRLPVIPPLSYWASPQWWPGHLPPSHPRLPRHDYEGDQTGQYFHTYTTIKQKLGRGGPDWWLLDQWGRKFMEMQVILMTC